MASKRKFSGEVFLVCKAFKNLSLYRERLFQFYLTIRTYKNQVNKIKLIYSIPGSFDRPHAQSMYNVSVLTEIFARNFGDACVFGPSPDLNSTFLPKQNISERILDFSYGVCSSVFGVSPWTQNGLGLSMAGGVGFEPSTPNLGGWCSLRSYYKISLNHYKSGET
jgi:hypothetical protein